MKNVLVTGGAGYIGSHTCLALAEAGLIPVTYDNLSAGHRWAVKWGPLVEADISDSSRLSHTFRRFSIDAVIHFAASAYVHQSVQDPRSYYQNNFTNTLTLVDAALAAGVKILVFSSTCATYGAPQALPVDEDHPQLPINPYGETKLAVERLLKWYEGPYGMKTVALRYFNAAGADPSARIGELHSPETHIIPNLIMGALGSQTNVRVYGHDHATSDGTCIRDYVHVQDLADAHVLALKYLECGGKQRAFNLGTGVGTSIGRLIQAVELYTGAKIQVVRENARAGDPAVLVANGIRAGAELGWRPTRSDLRMIIQTAATWHKNDHRFRVPEVPHGAIGMVAAAN